MLNKKEIDLIVKDSDGHSFVGSASDVIRQAGFYLSMVLDYVPELISGVDLSGNVIFASAQHTLLLGVDDSLDNLTTEKSLYPAFIHHRFTHAVREALMGGEVVEWELNVKHKDGSSHLYRVRHVLIRSKKTIENMIFTMGVDVTEHKMAENTLRDHKSRINYMSFHDALTGLANRSLFYDRISISLSRAKRSGNQMAMLLIDLDRFKNVNDSLGHDAGDLFLKHSAQCLLEELRDTDTVARLGGDEFVVVLETICDAQDVDQITHKLLEALAQPTKVQGHEVSCTASIGVSMYPKDGETIDQLLKNADVAMYRAKAAGKNRVQFFKKTMSDSAVNYLLLENDLRKAIDNQDLIVYYQPQVDIRTHKIIGLEALVRWQHKNRGLVSPVHFIPLAEDTGLIVPLGDWVLRHACERFQSWLMQGINFGKVAVNISARQFREDHFEQTVVQTLLDTHLSPQYLELELTESSAMENAAQTIDMLNCLSSMGLSLSIDDFGTGYSSLAYLQRFPIQKLKIDRSFIINIDRNEADGAIAKSIIDLAHNMSLQVIAEGVERVAQTEWLVQRGCDQVQGFYYSKPLSEEQLLDLVNDPLRAQNTATGVRLLMTE